MEKNHSYFVIFRDFHIYVTLHRIARFEQFLALELKIFFFYFSSKPTNWLLHGCSLSLFLYLSHSLTLTRTYTRAHMLHSFDDSPPGNGIFAHGTRNLALSSRCAEISSGRAYGYTHVCVYCEGKAYIVGYVTVCG